MPLQPGDKLGPYEVLAPIGAGGMGEVWKALDPRLNRIVAIKRLKGQHTARFQQEAHAIAALNHPNICQIHDIGPDYLVMEYIEGKPLSGPLRWEEALNLAVQITSAMEEAHSKGILHRDLKPANILVTGKGTAKLLDFGLATLTTECNSNATQTIEGTILGTAAYMSPEQVEGKALDARSDIFSFGAVLYEMLSGARAFGGKSTASVLSAVLRDDPEPLKAPATMENIVRRCLAKQPSDRFQSMAAVRAALLEGSPAPAAEEARALHLPTGITRLIGRRRELAEIRDLLLREDVRLVNLTGPAGIGKTRLAIEVCQQMIKEFGHASFVELQDVLAPVRVPSAILHGLGLREDARPPLSRLIKYLEQSSGLLALDNFEQIADSAPLLQELLASCPRLKILVTSRALLHLRAEHEYVVPALHEGAKGSDLEQLLDVPAVALFLDRAPTIKPTLEAARTIAEICARLDGLPLAIELAAARSKLLSPHAMLERLRNRLQLLTGGARDLPERQQTLRRAIDWSYDLLAPNQKLLLQSLSVFAAGAGVESVEAVCGGAEGDILDLLTCLVDQSLLQKEEDRHGNLRVRMLETIREHARERLEQSGNAPLVCARHAAHYLAVAEEMDSQGSGGSQDERYDLLEADQSNCLAALDWFLKQRNAEAALRMAVALWPLWEARGYWTEGREQLNRVLKEAAGGPPLARAKALYAAGVLADAQGDYSAARKAFEEHSAIQRTSCTPAALAAAINNLGVVALRQDDYESARSAYLEALEIFRSLDSHLSLAQCLNNLGHVAMATGDYATAQENYRESLAICRRLRSARDIAWTLSNLGDVARELSQPVEAEALYSQSLSLFREIDDRVGLASCMSDLGNLAVLRDQYCLAAQLYQESLVIFGDLGDRRGIARVLEGFAAMASSRARSDVALTLAGAAMAVRNSLGLHQSRAERLRLDTSISAARTALGSDADRVSAEGQRMPLEKVLAYALATAVL